MSDFIITLDVGGQMIKTQISTLTKYPDSMLAIMFQHTTNGLSPMPMTNVGAYFLDANPVYFGITYIFLVKKKIQTKSRKTSVVNQNLAKIIPYL